MLRRAGLVRDARALVGVEQRQRVRQRLVEHLRAQAAADDEQPQRPAAAGKALGRLGQRLDLGAHRVAGDERALGLGAPRRRRSRSATRSATGSSARLLISSDASAFTSISGLPSSRGHQPAGEAHVAAHAEHRVGAARAQDADAVARTP